MAGPFGQAPSLNFNKSAQAIAELQSKGALTRRMLMVASAKALSENIPLEDAIAICKAGPAVFVQEARPKFKIVGLALKDDDLREVFGQVCWLTSRRVDREKPAMQT